jgi:chromosome segregation ATPase
MVEPIMYFGIGFVAAVLLAVIVLPLVHNRAVRLTARRLEAATPLSMAEIQADKDQLRAEFAMSTRRLEMSVEQLKAKTTSQLADLGKKTDAINRLKADLSEKTAAIFALEAREAALKDQIRTAEQEHSVKTSAVNDAHVRLSEKEGELGRLTNELSNRTVISDSQRVEIVALRTQVEALKAQSEKSEKELRDVEEHLASKRVEVESATRSLVDEREKIENLNAQLNELNRQLIAQQTEAALANRRVQNLETRLAEQGRLLAEREFEATQSRSDADTARKVERDLRAELTILERRHTGTIDSLRTEKGTLESELDRVREERAQLQREIAAMKREAEQTWAAERVENALLRERINDIATEVARLTMVLEGPGSTIENLLGEASEAASRAADGKNGKTAERAEGNLADRIRALQARASRVAPAQ